ncbi:MAG TPA: phosphotransferase [Rhizomicrobium sp.]
MNGSEDNEEIAFSGGLIAHQTVRVGDTIRRPAGAWTPAVHALLSHLAAKNFPAPRPLGIDDKGREILSFIDGQASTWPWPQILRSPAGMAKVGAMLRRYHDCVADFSGPEVWQKFSRPIAPGEIICHGDFGAQNLIWRHDEIVGVIDWEFAYPALAIEDVAFAAWMMVPLRPDDELPNLGFGAPPDRRERLAALLRGYGRFEAGAVIETACALQQRDYHDIETLGGQGIEPWKTYREAGLAERTMRDQAWLKAWPPLA